MHSALFSPPPSSPSFERGVFFYVLQQSCRYSVNRATRRAQSPQRHVSAVSLSALGIAGRNSAQGVGKPTLVGDAFAVRARGSGRNGRLVGADSILKASRRVLSKAERGYIWGRGETKERKSGFESEAGVISVDPDAALWTSDMPLLGAGSFSPDAR